MIVESNEEKRKAQLAQLYLASESDLTETTPSFSPFYSKLKPETLRYVNKKLIAKGGMKEIYQVFDPKVGRSLALANLHENAPKELYEPFLREAYVTAKLDHPNIITIFDIGLNEAGKPYFTMELKAGLSFKEVIENAHKNSYPEIKVMNQLLDIFMKICDTMEYAHSKGILHLDLKPENIQVGTHGEVIICDWGLAKVLQDEITYNGEMDSLLLNPDLLNNLTLHGKVKGTPGFMAPEQVHQNSEKTVQTDIYALGAILYTLVSNSLTISNADLDTVLSEIGTGKIMPLSSELRQHLPESLQIIIFKALSHKSEERYPSVLAIREDLRRFMSGRSSAFENASFLKEIKLFYLRNKLVCNLCMALTLVIITITGLAFNQLKQKLKAEELGKIEQEKAKTEEQKRQQTEKDTWAEFHQKALTALTMGDFSATIENAKIAARHSGEISEPANLIALVHFFRGDYQQANGFFHAPLTPIFDSLVKLNQRYLENAFTPNEEIQHIEELLTLCQLTDAYEVTTAIFTYYLGHNNVELRKLATKYLNLNISDAEHFLTFAKEMVDINLKEIVIKKVVETLLKNKTNINWRNRRKTVELALLLVNEKQIQDDLQTIFRKNLAIWQDVKATGLNSKNPEKAVDGDLSGNSCWSASPCPASLEIDLGKVEVFNSFCVYFRQNVERNLIYTYTVEASNDGKNYQLILDKSDNIRRHELHRSKFNTISARFVRLNVLNNNKNLGAHVSEVEIWYDGKDLP